MKKKETINKILSSYGGHIPPQSLDLLRDCLKVFEDLDLQELRTAVLLEALCSTPKRPWRTYSSRESLTPRHLAGLLKDFGIIHSRDIRFKSGVAKGYRKSPFVVAYLLLQAAR